MTKRICAALALAAAMTVAFPSCQKATEPGKEEETKKDDDNKKDDSKTLVLEIALENISSTGVEMTVTPSIEDETFYFDILGNEAFALLQSKGVQNYFDGEVAVRQTAYELTKEETIAKMLTKGLSGHIYTKLTPDTEYHAVAFAVSAEGKTADTFVQKDFKTDIVYPSSNILDITVSNIAADGADYAVKASNEDTYLVDIWLKDLVDELGDEETMKYFIEYNSYMIPMLSVNGDFALENEQVCQPGREYYVIAFGYADGEPTTKLYKKEFKTVGGDPANCTFKFAYSDLESDKVTIRVTPSDKQVVYIWNVLDMTTFNEYKKTCGTDEATLEYILNGGIEETMTAEMVKRQQAVESLGRWSGYTTSDPEGYDEELISGLPSGEEFIVWAVTVDVNGKTLGKFYTDKFTTPKK